MQAMDLDPDDATLFSNRSLCWLRLGDGKKALLDAMKCKHLRPKWGKAYYWQGAALMFLEVQQPKITYRLTISAVPYLLSKWTMHLPCSGL